MSYIHPDEYYEKLLKEGYIKLNMPFKITFVKSFMGGLILSLAAFFAIKIIIVTEAPLIGAIFFPIGFIIIYLMKYDLLTGVFMLTPLAYFSKKYGIKITQILKNWSIVFLGNLLGALLMVFLVSFIVTYGYNVNSDIIIEKLIRIGESRTIGYMEYGTGGWITIFIKGMFCNWMVSLGVVGFFMSNSLVGKIFSMWMPIMLFFFMGFEHSIVNMFLFPIAILLGANFDIYTYILWNEIPTVLGNLMGGLLFTALPLFLLFNKNKKTLLL